MAQLCCVKNKYQWVYPENKSVSADIIKTAGSHIVAQLLVNRGIDTVEKIQKFLDPDNAEMSSPFAFPDMEKAVELINKVIEKQDHIVIYGDFDADGVTSTSLLYKTLKYLNANVSYFIPDRSDEGHGLNSASVCRLISTRKAKLIITVDCGISNYAEITLAKGLGTDIIITDHHESPELKPPAYAIINPKLIEEETGFKYLAGVGVAYKLACALLESNNKQDYAEKIIYLAAVGTIADVVPLLNENRTIVSRGLKLISEEVSPGLVALLKSSGYKIDQCVSADMIAFGAAPRINAIGRLAEASIAVELLTNDDPEEIDLLAKKLNYNNKIRQQMCESTFIETSNKINIEVDLEKDGAVVLADPNWHPGIIGIVASKLVEKYYRPVFLIAVDKENNKGRCSARSIAGVNLHEVLTANSELFEQFGGHAFAAGFSFDLNKISFEELKDKLNLTVSQKLDPTVFEPKLNIDMEIDSQNLSIELVEELYRLAPFGDSNPSPVFSFSNLTLKQYKTMGSSNNHLKVFLSDDNDNTFEAVWWQKNSLDAEVLDKVNVAFCPDINTYAGNTKLQLVVKDIQKVNSSGSASSSRIKEERDIPVIQESSTKWTDHRKKSGIEKTLSNYLKTTQKDVAVFAEDRGTLELLNKDLTIKDRIINRLNIDKTNQLILFDFPPDREIFSLLTENSSADIIHLVGKNYKPVNPAEIIKTLSGMLKFAYNNRNGEVNIDQAASFLCLSNSVVASCIELLDKAGVIKILDLSLDFLKFEFVGSADMVSIVNLEEYNLFIDEIKLVEDFRDFLASEDIDTIQKFVE